MDIKLKYPDLWCIWLLHNASQSAIIFFKYACHGYDNIRQNVWTWRVVRMRENIYAWSILAQKLEETVTGWENLAYFKNCKTSLKNGGLVVCKEFSWLRMWSKSCLRHTKQYTLLSYKMRNILASTGTVSFEKSTVLSPVIEDLSNRSKCATRPVYKCLLAEILSTFCLAVASLSFSYRYVRQMVVCAENSLCLWSNQRDRYCNLHLCR